MLIDASSTAGINERRSLALYGFFFGCLIKHRCVILSNRSCQPARRQENSASLFYKSAPRTSNSKPLQQSTFFFFFFFCAHQIEKSALGAGADLENYLKSISLNVKLICLAVEILLLRREDGRPPSATRIRHDWSTRCC